MSLTTRIQNKGQVTIPTRVRDRAGPSKGDVIEYSYRRGKIVITPKIVIDRSSFPDADDEYTPAQRRSVNARLAESDENFKHRRTYGPFDSAEGIIAHMKAALKSAPRSNTPARAMGRATMATDAPVAR
jgi:bifunctional DNA-binding transcriptional regulator/antitoxin component of YhaV-PrlF toxin-antitoxin module